MGAGVGYDIKIPPLFSRSETNTDDMKKMDKFFKEEEGRVIHTRHFNFLHCHVTLSKNHFDSKLIFSFCKIPTYYYTK